MLLIPFLVVTDWVYSPDHVYTKAQVPRMVGKALSISVATGMTRIQVEKVLGRARLSDTYGPPGESVSVDMYPGVCVTFDHAGRVMAVSR